jgi:RNA polymerase sigma-70 factor (ECF subfamily)
MQLQERTSTQSAKASDGALVRQALAGDQRAFETLVGRYHALLFHSIYRYMGDYDQTCDVLQHVLLQLYSSLPTLQQREPLGPWLLRVARNSCVDELRRRRRRRSVCFSELEREADEEELSPLASIPDPHSLPEEIAEHHDLQYALLRAIQALPPRSRAVVLLRYTDQLSFPEIGQTLKIPTTTAKSYFYRARPLLQALLTAIISPRRGHAH